MDDLNDEENELEDLASFFSRQALVFSCFSLSRTWLFITEVSAF